MNYAFSTATFPNGTTVYANALDGDGEAVAAVVSAGVATFVGLREATEYVVHAYVAGAFKQDYFRSPADSPGSSGAFTTAITSRGADGTSSIVAKAAGEGTPALFNWTHNDSVGYLLHFNTGAGVPHTGAALIGMGIDNDGQGLLVNNKKSGVGITLNNQGTINSATAYGLQGFQASTVAPLVRLEMNTGVDGADVLQLQSFGSPAAGTRLLYVGDPAGQAGEIQASGGVLRWIRDVLVQDDNSGNERRLHVQSQANASANNTHHAYLHKLGLRVYPNTGAGAFWPFFVKGSGSHLVFQAGASGATTTGAETVTTLIDLQNTKIGFFGATPVVQQTLAVAGSDAATTQTLANSLRTALIALGLGV